MLVKGHKDEVTLEKLVYEWIGLLRQQGEVRIENRPTVTQRLKSELAVKLEGWLERDSAGTDDIQIVAVKLISI